MAHHAYFVAGGEEEGIEVAVAYGERELGLARTGNPDVIVLRYGLFSVDDARKVGAFALQGPVAGDQKLIVIAAGRLFHEAQNALLKLFEEPTEGTTLILVVPAEGMLLPTLRSRLIRLPHTEGHLLHGVAEGALLQRFLDGSGEEREKMVAKLLDRTKSDKDEEKQAARGEAVRLVEGLTRTAYAAREKAKGEKREELDKFLADLDAFTPLMHDRSGPLKLIFEHLLLVFPEGLGK